MAKRDTIRAARLKKVAESIGVSTRYVRMVLADERNNPQVNMVMQEIIERENVLLEEVKRMIPFEVANSRPSAVKCENRQGYRQ